MRAGLILIFALSAVAVTANAAEEEEFNFFAEEVSDSQPVPPADDNSDNEDSFSFFTTEEPDLSATKDTLNFSTVVSTPKDRKLPLSFRFNGEVGLNGASDVRFDQPGEDVSQFQSWGLFTTEARLGRYMRIYSNFALYWNMRGQAPEGDKPYLLFNTANKRYEGGFDLLETFAEFNFMAGLSLRVGNLLFPWGQNDVLPAVNLNPLDARLSYQNGMHFHAPVPAVAFNWNRRWFTAKLAWIPWFRPHKAALLDKDFSLAPAGSEYASKLSILKNISPTLLQELVDDPLATEVPDYSIKNSTVALRLEAESPRADFALSVAYGFDRTPRLQLDDNLLFLSGRVGDILNNPTSLLVDPELAAAFLALRDGYAAGDTLFKLDYQRQLTLGFDMAVQIWDFILKLDVAFQPHKILYDAALNYSRSPFLQSALALEYNYGTSLYLSLTFFAMFSFDNKLLPLLDFKMAGSDTSYLTGFFFLGRKTFLDDKLKIELLLAISATYGDFLLRGTVDYKLAEHHIFGLGAMFVHGPDGSLGKRYDGTDNIFTYYRWLF